MKTQEALLNALSQHQAYLYRASSQNVNDLINLSSMKYFSFLASFGKLAYLDLSNKPL